MSSRYYKKTFLCDCQCDYGNDCGKRTAFVLVQRNVSDTYSLTVNYDYDNPESKFESILCVGEAGLSALIDLMKCGSESPEEITESDIIKTRNVF